ncbi:MAG: NADH-quinone oxidoreductase subunit J [Bacteroidota bacterium]
MVTQFMFFLLATVAIAAALGTLIARNPVNSALWLILNLFCIAGLYLTLNAQFIGVIQVLVYAGAIMVLFLFVIMLLNLSELPRPADANPKLVAGFSAGVVLMALLVYAIASGFDALPEPVALPELVENGSPKAIARELFTVYALPFEMIGILLLVATIGAVMLAKKRFA